MNTVIALATLTVAYVMSEVWPLPGLMLRAFERIAAPGERRQASAFDERQKP